MEAPGTFTELIMKFIDNETNIVTSNKSNKHPLAPSSEIGMLPGQAEMFYKSQLPFFKMADSKEASINSNKYYFKLIRTMFLLYLPKTTVHMVSVYSEGAEVFSAQWVFKIVSGKLVITATKMDGPANTIVINTKNYE